MKNKIGKKILATFLSLLMVFTSLVFVVPEFKAEAIAGTYYGKPEMNGAHYSGATGAYGTPVFDGTTDRWFKWQNGDDWTTVYYPSEIYLDKTESLEGAGYYFNVQWHFGNSSTYRILLGANVWGDNTAWNSYGDGRIRTMNNIFSNYSVDASCTDAYYTLGDGGPYSGGSNYDLRIVGYGYTSQGTDGFNQNGIRHEKYVLLRTRQSTNNATIYLKGNPNASYSGTRTEYNTSGDSFASYGTAQTYNTGKWSTHDNGAAQFNSKGSSSSYMEGQWIEMQWFVTVYDKAALNAEVTKGNSIVANATKDGTTDYYVYGDRAIIDDFVAKLNTASSTLTTRATTQSAIGTAESQLETAAKKVCFAANNAELLSALSSADSIMSATEYSAKYTEATRMLLEKAVNAARNSGFDSGTPSYSAYDIDNALDLARDDQATINDLTGDINEALNNMGIQTYTVTFQNAVGGTHSTQTVAYGSAATAPVVNPTKAYDENYHYTFSKWDTDFSNITGNLTVKPVYTSTAHTANSYEVAIQGNNGTGTHTAKCTCGYSKTVNCTWGDPVTTTAATCHSDAIDTYTCTVCQLNSYTATVPTTIEHNFTAWAATADGHTRSCQNSGCTETQTAQHTYDNAWDYEDESNHMRKCNVCGLEESKETHAHDNNWVWKETTPVTCTSDGVETRFCEVCGKTETRTVKTKGHTDPDDTEADAAYWEVVTEATCETAGSKKALCKVCGVETGTTSVIAATGHSYTNYVSNGDATCTADGTKTATCDNGCGKTDTVADTDSKLPHDYTLKSDKSNLSKITLPAGKAHKIACAVCGDVNGVSWTLCSTDATETEPTCTDDGYFTCNVCAQTWDGEAAKGHTDPADTEADAAYWEVVTEATCETAGSKKALCKVCGVETGTTAEIPATGHAYTSVVTTKATCFDDGVRTYTCPNVNCEVPSYTETILKREHNYDEGVVTKPATFTEDGIMTYTCQNAETETHAACTHSYTEAIAAGEDSTAPEGEIKWGTTVWNSFLTAITFGKYTNYDVTLEISATDAESGVKSIEYFVSDKAYANADALEAEATWEEYKAASLTVPAADKETVVVYAKLTNNDEDVAYISTEDITFDMNAPVITVTGVGTGNVYCESATVSFSDDASGIDLDTRRIGYLQAAGYTWTEAEDILRDEPLLNVPGTYKVQVKDKAGNLAETEIVVQAHDFSDNTDTTEVVDAATCTTGTIYKVGCTNCDALSDTLVWEADDEAGHTPDAAVTENEKDATCTDDGSYDTVVYCSVCNTELSRDTIPVTALGHTPDAAVTENEKAANCTDDGSYDTVVYCSVCGTELSRDTIPVTALGHDFKDTADKSKVAAEATCTTGTKYYVGCTVCDEVSTTETWEDDDALDHAFTSGEYIYDTADDTHTQKCIRCDAYGAEEDCEFSAWAEYGASMHKRECVCGNTETGACVDNDPVVTPNTCTEGGYTTNTCETCNRVWKTDITSMKGHDFTGEYKINADGTHTFKCQNNCGEYGNATVCTYGAWTADAANRQHYRKCVCGRTETVDCIDKAEVTTVPATCLADEKTVYECQVCHNTWENVKAGTQKDHSYTGEYIKGNAATDIHQRKCVNGCGQYADEACKFTNNFKSAGDKVHTADCLCGNTQELNCPAMPVGMTDATCEDNAYMNYECEDCGNKWAIEQKDTALGHSYTNFVTVTPATCSRNGKKVATCDNGCGTTKSTVIPVDKNNHTGGTEVVGAFAATCQKEGYTGDTNCLACGSTIKVGTSIPVGDHDWDNGKTIREANCIGTGLKVYTCKAEGCGKTEEREIAVDPTNHANVQTGVGLDPTCTVPGYTGATECLACGTTIKTGTPIKELGHDIGPWEITVMPTDDGSVLGEAIRYCLRCGGERETKTGIAFEDVHLVIYHNYDGTRLTMPRYYIKGDKTLRPEDEPVRIEDDQYTYKFIGWDFADDQLNCVQMEMPVVAQYKATEKSYAVTFKDINGKVIQTVPGNTPYSEIAKAYNGATPTKPSDAENNYVFSGWGIKCDYETGTAEVFPTFRKVPIKVEEEPNDGIFGWLIRWIKSLLAKIGIVL